MTTIRKNSSQLPDLKERLTVCTRYDSDNQFQGRPCDPAWAWDKLPGRRSRLTSDGDGTHTIHVHENLWYELREPEPAAAPDEGAVGDVKFRFPGGTKVTVDPDGTVLDGPDTPAPPEPTEASVRAVLDAAGYPGLPSDRSAVRDVITEALRRGWLRGWQDAQQAKARPGPVLGQRDADKRMHAWAISGRQTHPFNGDPGEKLCRECAGGPDGIQHTLPAGIRLD